MTFSEQQFVNDYKTVLPWAAVVNAFVTPYMNRQRYFWPSTLHYLCRCISSNENKFGSIFFYWSIRFIYCCLPLFKISFFGPIYATHNRYYLSSGINARFTDKSEWRHLQRNCIANNVTKYYVRSLVLLAPYNAILLATWLDYRWLNWLWFSVEVSN